MSLSQFTNASFHPFFSLSEDFIKENDGEGDEGKAWKSFSPSAVTFGGGNADENKEVCDEMYRTNSKI